MKKILAVLMTCVVIFNLVACGNKDLEDRTEEIFNRGYLIMGMDDSFAPMGFRDEEGNLAGFDVDLAREVFKRLGVEVRFQPVDWSMKEAELNSNKIDVIWNGYSVTDKRKEQVNFSDVYLENKQVIATMKDSSIEKKADLKNKKVAVQSQSSALDAINREPKLVETFNQGEPVLFDTNHEAIMDVESARSDAVVVDEVLMKYYISKKDRPEDYKILEENFGSEVYAIGLRKSDEKLLGKINQVLRDMKEDGSFDEVYNKWF